MSLVVSNIQKQYDGQKAVDNISFDLHPGEIVGFLGPNGAGKSTTLKMIAGVLMPDAGKITINNQLVQMDSIASKKLIGYLPESNPLYKDLYVKEYLQFLGTIHQVNQLRAGAAANMALISAAALSSSRGERCRMCSHQKGRKNSA